jgi:hypothetical protein
MIALAIMGVSAHRCRHRPALGQKRTSRWTEGMSALPPKSDIAECDRQGRFVPKADMERIFDPVAVQQE